MYELLTDLQRPRRRTLIFCLAVIFLLCTACVWVGISLPKMFYFLTLRETKGKAIAGVWSGSAGMYAESSMEKESADKNISVDLARESYDTTGKLIVCYYTVPESSDPKWDLPPSEINPHICTHIIIGFAKIINCTVHVSPDSSPFGAVVNLRKRNPNLKVMLSVGGGNELNSGFAEMVKNHANRKRFIRSVLNLTKVFELDGLDLDWEFPAWFGAEERQKIHFVQLIEEVRKEFDRSREKLILSVAVAAPKAIVDQSYNVPEIAEYVDFVNLMSYDYHYYIWYYPVTGLNAPLFPNVMESGYLATLNVNFSACYWVTKGMPREKIVVGIPTYGHSYKLDNPLNHKLQAPADGFGTLGSGGFVAYSIICQFLKRNASYVFENESKVPYAYKNDEWISYDNNESIYHKAKWILENGFKGAMIFSLNTDDWKNNCNPSEPFPLIRAVGKIFNNHDQYS